MLPLMDAALPLLVDVLDLLDMLFVFVLEIFLEELVLVYGAGSHDDRLH